MGKGGWGGVGVRSHRVQRAVQMTCIRVRQAKAPRPRSALVPEHHSQRATSSTAFNPYAPHYLDNDLVVHGGLLSQLAAALAQVVDVGRSLGALGAQLVLQHLHRVR